MMTWDQVVSTIRRDHESYEFSIGLIRDRSIEKEKKQTIKKEDLPVFYTATFEPDAQTATEGSSFSTGLMCFDLDYYDPALVQHLRDSLMNNSALSKVIFMMFKSPSGGLKFLIKTNLVTDDARLWSYAYQRMSDLLNIKIVEGLPEDVKKTLHEDDFNVCDPQCKNINRGCYFSIDADMYYNGQCSTFMIADKMNAEIENERRRDREVEARRVEIAKQMEATEDTRARDRYREVAVNNIIKDLYNGQRHSKYWSLAKVILETGGSEFDVATAFRNCEMIGQWTEEMGPEAKARDCYRHFQRSNIPQKTFYKEQNSINIRARIAQMRAEQGL